MDNDYKQADQNAAMAKGCGIACLLCIFIPICIIAIIIIIIVVMMNKAVDTVDDSLTTTDWDSAFEQANANMANNGFST